MKTWINKKTIGICLFGLILLLIFFSKTIYTWHLPEVTAVKPYNGKLSKVEAGHGTAMWANVDSVYIPEAGTIARMYAREGEYVAAGQELFAMDYDRDENDRKLLELDNTRKRLLSEKQGIEDNLRLAERPSAELLDARQAQAQAQWYFNAAGSLYEIGSISTQEYNEARDQASYLTLKLDNLQAAEAERKNTLTRELAEKKLELEQLAIEEAAYQKIQETHDTKVVITAPSAGMLIETRVAGGQLVSKDTLALTIGTGNDYILECPVSLENNFISTGDSCKLSNASNQLKGTVSGIVPGEQQKIIKIRFTAEQITAGETFDVMFQKESETNFILVPNACVSQDQDGYYLKQIKRRSGMMGQEYYLERIDIYIGDTDARNTVVTQGITFFEPVMLFANKTAVTGDVIMLKNAGDFFEE